MVESFQSTLSVDRAIAALQDVLAAYKLPENVNKLDEAKDNAGNNMLKHMHLVFPIAVQIQEEVLVRHGISAHIEGLIQFSQAVRDLEKDNEELHQLNSELRAILIPPMLLPSLQNTIN